MSGTTTLSSSMQDYLEAILELAEKENSVRITDIAIKLNIAKASVKQTVDKLKDLGLVKQQTYGPVELTNNGRELANSVRQRHIKLRRFLIEVLGVNPKVAEKDACLMKHVVSPQTIEKLAEFLCQGAYGTDGCNKASRDASGNIILKKTAEGREGYVLNPINTKSLSTLKIGQKGKVIRIATKGVVRKRIVEMGITAGTEIYVKGFAPLGDPMELLVKGYNLSLRKEEAADIFVEVL